MTSMLAQAANDPTFSWWWDTAQKVGAGATFVLGIVVAFLWKAYLDKDRQLAAEVAYSKERDKSTLSVMIELTTLVKTMDKRDAESAAHYQHGTDKLLTAIADVKSTIIQHFQQHRP